MRCDLRHCRKQQQRIIHWDLQTLLKGVFRRALVDIIGTQDVGEEDAFKLSTLEKLGELCPILEIGILMGAILRVGPEAWRLMPGTIHRESIKLNLSGHFPEQRNQANPAAIEEVGSRNSAKELVRESHGKNTE
jgi:hypothetical protein